MSNWFENHPAKSIIIYSLTLSGFVWAITRFALYDNKNDKHKTEIDILNSQIDTYKMRIEVLEIENKKTHNLNEKYLNWLIENPTTFHHLEDKIKEIQSKLANDKNSSQDVNKIENKESFDFEIVDTGSSFYNSELKIFVGISDITVKKEASGKIKFPDGKEVSFSKSTAGKSWNFKTEKTEYSLLLRQIDFIGSRVKFSIVKV